jgi:hypothetical protein
MKKIGKGAFSTVYRKNNQVFYKSKDIVKEAMAYGFFPNSKLFPEIQFCYEEGFDFKGTYDPDMKSRSVIPKLNTYYQTMYRELKEFENKLFSKRASSMFCEKADCYQNFKNEVGKLKIRKHHKEALIGAFEALMNYVSAKQIYFEISPRNVSTKNGKLILHDCFYIR